MRVLNRASQDIRSWWERSGKDVLAGLDGLERHEILEKLPTYLGADIYDAVTGGPGAHPGTRTLKHRPVVMLDTYQDLWEGHSLRSGEGAFGADAWVRRLVKEAPGILFVVFSRDPLHWEEIAPELDQVVAQHELKPPSPEEVDRFLEAVPVTEAGIRNKIASSSRGLPFYLELQVDLYEQFRSRGEPFDAKAFGGPHPKVIDRFLKYTDAQDRDVLRVTALARYVDESIYNHLRDHFFPGSSASFADFADHSFNQPSGDGRIVMHTLMRDALVTRASKRDALRLKRVHTSLWEWHDQRAQVSSPLDFTPDVEAAMLEAAYHLEAADPGRFVDWCSQRVVACGDAGQLALGLYLAERALVVAKRTLGSEHPDTLTSGNNLAAAYLAAGRMPEALPLYEATLKERERTLGPEHPSTLASRNNLAGAYRDAGRLPEALPLYEATLEATERMMGPEHPNTLTSRNNLASAYRAAGRLPEALPLLEATLKAMERTLGPEHPNTLTSRNNLASAYLAARRVPEALPLYEATLTAMERTLGREHPGTLMSRNNLASAYRAAGRLPEALPLFEATLEARERTLGPEHPNTLTVKGNLASLYRALGRLSKALPLYEATLEAMERTLGPEHPNTLTVKGNLEVARREAGLG